MNIIKTLLLIVSITALLVLVSYLLMEGIIGAIYLRSSIGNNILLNSIRCILFDSKRSHPCGQTKEFAK